MEIYIEDFLIENILINYSLLSLIHATTKSKTSVFKMILASIIASIFSIFYMCFVNNKIIINCLKIICASIIILIAFKSSKKQFFYNFILLFIYTYSLGGIITAFTFRLSTNNGRININPNASLIYICIFVIILTNIFKLVMRTFKTKLIRNNYIYPISITYKGTTINVNAYLDTGNLVRYKNTPVIIIDLKAFMQLFKTLPKFEQIQINSATSKKSLRIVEVDSVSIIDNGKTIKLKHQYLAISNNTLGENFNALLSPEMI